MGSNKTKSIATFVSLCLGTKIIDHFKIKRKKRRIVYKLGALLLVAVCVLLLYLKSKNEASNKQDRCPSTIRQTTHGPVEGIEETSVFGQKYYAFRGIPYAAPPITGIDPYTNQKVDRRFKV